jgi:hypothetical protein
MKKALFILLSIFSFGFSHAQKWAPIGSKWTYSFMEGLGTFYREYPVLWETKDTITIQGKLCSITCPKTTGGVWLDDTTDMFKAMITYEDSGKVYWYVPDSAFFTVLYDFTKNVGESWEIKGMHLYGFTKSCPLKVTVQSVGVDTINGIPLKSMVIKDPSSLPVFGGKIIQGIGNLYYPRPIPYRICATPSDVDDYYGLRCIDIPGIGVHDFKIVPTCDYTKTSIKEQKQSNTIVVNPNPSSSDYELQYHIQNTEPLQLKVSDLTGRLILNASLSPQKNSYHIKADNWVSGVYIYQLISEGVVLKNGKLIKE